MATLMQNCRTRGSVLGYVLALAVLTAAVAAQRAVALQPDAPPVPTPNDELPIDSSATEDHGTSSHTHDHDEDRQTAGFFAKLVHWLGKFHPVSVHFPIALLVVAALAEVLRAVSDKPNFRFAARFCLLLGTLGAVASATLG